MSWPVFRSEFDIVDAQIKNSLIIPSSMRRAPPLFNFTNGVCPCYTHISAAPISCTSSLHFLFLFVASISCLHLSFASTICSSQSPSQLQLSFAPLFCTCCLHFFFAHFIGTSRLHITLTQLSCKAPFTSRLHLTCSLHLQLLFESMVCTSSPQPSLAALMCTSQCCFSSAGFSWAFRLQ